MTLQIIVRKEVSIPHPISKSLPSILGSLAPLSPAFLKIPHLPPYWQIDHPNFPY